MGRSFFSFLSYSLFYYRRQERMPMIIIERKTPSSQSRTWKTGCFLFSVCLADRFFFFPYNDLFVYISRIFYYFDLYLLCFYVVYKFIHMYTSIDYICNWILIYLVSICNHNKKKNNYKKKEGKKNLNVTREINEDRSYRVRVYI